MASKSFIRHEEARAVEMLPGVVRRNLAQTDDMLLIEVRGDAQATVPLHSHPHQQVGYVVSGEIALTIGGVEANCKPGDSYTIPGDVEHGAAFVMDTVVIDCFSPVREDYLDS